MNVVLVLRTTNLGCWPRKFEGISAYASEKGWRLEVIDGDLDPKKLKVLLDFWHPTGCIVEADGGMTSLRPSHFNKTPCVFLDHTPDFAKQGTPVIRHDSAEIARVAAKELLLLDHQDYAILGWFSPAYWMRDKFNAFKSIMELHGKTVHEFNPVSEERADVAELQRRLKEWLIDLPKPCALFGVNDFIAERAIWAASAAGISVPDDLAIIGADNDEMICETSRPTLTSVLPDFKTTGYKAAETLDEIINGRIHRPTILVVPPLGIVRRQSTRRFQRPDQEVQTAMERIRREAASGLKAADVVAGFTCSRRQAEIRFRNLTGHSILEEIQTVRFRKTLELLSKRDMTISAVADLSGWPSEVVLARYTKTTTGKTLSQLRRERKSPDLCKGDVVDYAP